MNNRLALPHRRYTDRNCRTREGRHRRCHPELAEGSLDINCMNDYYVYILTNERDRLLYIGVTNNLSRRIYEHKNRLVPGFTSDYRIHKLVYFEVCHSAEDAIRREKQLKNWRREKKIELIERMNPYWKDFGEDF